MVALKEMQASQKKVWVIGANSFTGTYLLPMLQRSGYRVDTHTVDITSATEVEEAVLSICPDYIINLAAISFVPAGQNASVYAVNTFGPQYILDACLKLEKPPLKIILASSASVYGVQAEDKISEECQPNPVDHYGCSKWAMEQIARTYRDRLNILITRPFNYTGPGQNEKFLIPKIVQHFKDKAATLHLGNLDVARDFSNVRWIARAYVELLSLKNESLEDKSLEDNAVGVVNLCSGAMTSIDGVIEILHKLTGVSLDVESSAGLVRSSDILRQCGSNERLYRMLPLLDSPIDIVQTLQQMVFEEGVSE